MNAEAATLDAERDLERLQIAVAERAQSKSPLPSRLVA
jgi:hypothetical protein